MALQNAVEDSVVNAAVLLAQNFGQHGGISGGVVRRNRRSRRWRRNRGRRGHGTMELLKVFVVIGNGKAIWTVGHQSLNIHRRGRARVITNRRTDGAQIVKVGGRKTGGAASLPALSMPLAVNYIHWRRRICPTELHRSGGYRTEGETELREGGVYPPPPANNGTMATAAANLIKRFIVNLRLVELKD